jgi:hypothetical protein
MSQQATPDITIAAMVQGHFLARAALDITLSPASPAALLRYGASSGKSSE